MPDRATISYDALVLCDDIRLEFDGKRTLVGVYTAHSIAVPFLPFQAGMSLHAAGIVEKEGSFRASFQVEDHEGKILYENKADETVELQLGRFIQSLFLPVMIADATFIKISLFDEERYIASLIHPVVVKMPDANLQQAL